MQFNPKKKSLLSMCLKEEKEISQTEKNIIQYLELQGITMFTQVNSKMQDYYDVVRLQLFTEESDSTASSGTPDKGRKGSLNLENSRLFSKRKEMSYPPSCIL